jgi:hypothetical protein
MSPAESSGGGVLRRRWVAERCKGIRTGEAGKINGRFMMYVSVQYHVFRKRRDFK